MIRRASSVVFLILAISFVRPDIFRLAAQTGTKSSLDSALDRLLSVHTFLQLKISPDGSRVAWVESSLLDGGVFSDKTAIFVAETGHLAAPRRLKAAGGEELREEHDLAWSPDSKKLAFLSDAETKGQLQLYVADVPGGNPKKVTNLKGFLANPQWSPDGKVIAILFAENAPSGGGPLRPMTPDSGVVEQQIFEQSLTVVDVASGRVRRISPADLFVYEYDWSPDGKQFAAIAAHGSGDNNWWVAQLYTLEINSGELKSILDPPLQIAIPKWSPDGKSIAYIGGIMSDEGFVGGDIFIISASGGQPQNLTPKVNSSPSWLTWLSPDQVLFTENRAGSAGAAKVSLSGGAITRLWNGPESISADSWGFSLSLAKDGKTSAVVRQSFTNAPEVWTGPIGAWKQVSAINKAARPMWGEGKDIQWINGGLRVQGWLIPPANYDLKKRYPLVVWVHGGPANENAAAWPNEFTGTLASQGYFVFCPNPRGSYGQGEAFTQANVKDFGYGDLSDILSGVDQVVRDFPIDNNRVGISGWSYGGFMTMWAVTQTNRFRAAVTGAGLSNWQSYYGENDIDEWMIPYFGASVYDDPAVYAKSSPITFIKNVKTPTLVVVGDRDGEVPAPQSYEFWHALKTLKVPTQLVVYPGEGHLFSQAEHRYDVTKRLVNWFDAYMPAGSSSSVYPSTMEHAGK